MESRTCWNTLNIKIKISRECSRGFPPSYSFIYYTNDWITFLFSLSNRWFQQILGNSYSSTASTCKSQHLTFLAQRIDVGRKAHAREVSYFLLWKSDFQFDISFSESITARKLKIGYITLNILLFDTFSLKLTYL